MVWQGKNSENKEENLNHFNPLGEKKEVPSASISIPSTQEALRNDSTKVNFPVTSQTGELKDQTDYPNDIVEVVADKFERKELQEKNDQPEEGEIPDSQEEKTDSSLLMPSLEIQEAQKCAILGLNLSDSDWGSKSANSDLNDSNASRTPNWGNQEEISKILSNPKAAPEINVEWKIPKHKNKKGTTPSTSLLRKSSRIAQVDVGYTSSSPS